MANKVPAYIKEEARKLNNALVAVKKHSQAIEAWVENNTEVDGMEFFHNNTLDNPYEFRLDWVLEALEDAVNQ